MGRALAEDMITPGIGLRAYDGIQFNAVVETNNTAVRLWQEARLHGSGHRPTSLRLRAHGRVGLHVMYLPLDGEDPT